MSDSDDEDFAFFGTPLEPFDEDAVSRKKPISVEDQIATDKYGKRRFHGAFTGGFSAGFFNSVGSLEGFKPSTFKSSRSDRSNLQQQLPAHFMDDEDIDEFGIAPQVLRTKSEYASTVRNSKKRDRQASFNSGPIPGEPVLQSILKPAKHTIGVLLLMKMGWKPGLDVGEKLQKRSSKMKQSSQVKTKVYGCARGPGDNTFSALTADDSDSDVEEEIYRELGEKAPSFTRKEDLMGLGYKGLDRNTLNFSGKISKPLTLKDQFNKTIRIAGQAFGVGAFEEEDDDIYSIEDRSQYDFSLEPLSKTKKSSNNIPALTYNSDVIIGFVKASFSETLKQYPGPLVPSSFTGQHVEKQSRFDSGPQDQKCEPMKQRLDAQLRSAILGTEQLPVRCGSSRGIINELNKTNFGYISSSLGTSSGLQNTRIKEEKTDEDSVVRLEPNSTSNKKNEDSAETSNKSGNSWKPFSSDGAKQERYDKYLNLIKIGAKDLVHTVLLNTMSDLERESELREFECAARLYSGKIMSDRFTHGQNLEDDKNIKLEALQEDKVRKRITSDWAPHPIVCKRFNIKPPDNTSSATLQSVADSKKKPKFSVFDFLNTSKSADLVNMIESNSRGDEDVADFTNSRQFESSENSVAQTTFPQTDQSLTIQTESKNNSSNKLFIDDDKFEEPEDKMDLFKAIFLDSDDESSDEKEKEKDEGRIDGNAASRTGETANILRNTSPPRGIFANLDLDKLSNKTPLADKPKETDKHSLELTAPPKSIFEKQKPPEDAPVTVKTEPLEVPENSYGPSLPSVPVEKPKNYVNLKLDVNDDRWVEKPSKEKHHKSKHHHKKKHKKEKKREKHKKKKKKKHSSSDSNSESD